MKSLTPSLNKLSFVSWGDQVEIWNKYDQKLFDAVEKGDVGRVSVLAGGFSLHRHWATILTGLQPCLIALSRASPSVPATIFPVAFLLASPETSLSSFETAFCTPLLGDL
uniref:Uncharacterized protein n=1 Tax=Salvator merianae TaxID=96440 RepID=A0A8D0BXP7_SALMN